jgi:hypothetical protein
MSVSNEESLERVEYTGIPAANELRPDRLDRGEAQNGAITELSRFRRGPTLRVTTRFRLHASGSKARP